MLVSRLLIDIHQSATDKRLGEIDTTVFAIDGNKVQTHKSLPWLKAKKLFDSYFEEKYSISLE